MAPELGGVFVMDPDVAFAFVSLLQKTAAQNHEEAQRIVRMWEQLERVSTPPDLTTDETRAAPTSEGTARVPTMLYL